MSRTRARPFVTGALSGGALWYLLVVALLALAVGAAAVATNWPAALYVFLGAFTYGVVYTMWLKRRTWLNIVIGGLAGSFAVLAGAAAVDPTPGPAAWIFAVVLFLWTPPHFWSLASYYRQDYAAAGVPMLPVVHGDRVAARAILAHTVPLVLLSLLPVAWGSGPFYALCAAAGGGYFIWRAWLLVRSPTPSQRHPQLPRLAAAARPAAAGSHRRGRRAGQPGPLLRRARREPWRPSVRESPLQLLCTWSAVPAQAAQMDDAEALRTSQAAIGRTVEGVELTAADGTRLTFEDCAAGRSC